LSRSFSPHLSKSHTHAAAVVLDEFDAGCFKGVADYDQGCPARLICACFQLANRNDPDPGLPCEISLAPIQEAPGGSALCRRNHGVSGCLLFHRLYRKWIDLKLNDL